MRASSQKPEFHLNANAGIVLTLQCRVLALTPPVQWPYKFPSLLLWPHNPKPSLAGNYMHFNTGNKRDLTSKYFAVMGFGIWTLNARWYSITGFFTWSFKWASSLQSHKKNHWGVWNFDSHWLPKVTPIRERYLECVHFQQIEGWEILKKVFWKSLSSQLHQWKSKAVRAGTSSCTANTKIIQNLYQPCPHYATMIICPTQPNPNLNSILRNHPAWCRLSLLVICKYQKPL